ncbi:MAG: Xaa-Pro peptidase family protein [Chloroflexota bacterium]|nr:Xaa-Pro peptidase family protein [Chloroflexota bacterium]
MTNRLETVQAALRETPFDLLVLVPGPNYYYVTGAPLHASERLNFLVLPKQGEPVALAPALEAPYLRPLGLGVYEWRDEEGPVEALHSLVQDLGVGNATAGVEYNVLRYGEAAMLRRAAPQLQLERADGFLSQLRAIKDEAELKALRHAIDVTERGLHRVLEEMRVGQTEREIAGMLRMNLLREGADGIAFGPLVVSGPRSAEAHAGPSDRAIQPGDVIIIDCGATVNHYSGDITRCVAVEPVPEEVERIYSLCRAANEAGRAAVKPGVTGHEVDAAARAVIEEGDYGEYFIHRTGHGLGLEIHEPPFMVAGNNEPLRVGNVFTVEPGIYVPGLGGVRVEDNVVVTQSGGESLTTFPRELIRLKQR